MNGPLQTLEGHLKTLGSAQNDLQAAFKGSAGTAVYNAFGNVLSTGTQVAHFIEEIIQGIVQASSKFDEEDRLAMEQVSRQIDAGLDARGVGSLDGSFGSGETGATGTWQSTELENSKVDVSGI
jgi:uncharacterized protein YukE